MIFLSCLFFFISIKFLSNPAPNSREEPYLTTIVTSLNNNGFPSPNLELFDKYEEIVTSSEKVYADLNFERVTFNKIKDLFKELKGSPKKEEKDETTNFFKESTVNYSSSGAARESSKVNTQNSSSSEIPSVTSPKG
ncbi:MAG: hypothetical protein H0W50_09405, partial [Parachlamydiaceae bacterium]|nr:hypothetical protein [Parachlamydiaceae bacterium]